MDKRRREDRIAVSLPIRVWGMDANHKPFNQTATTLDLTRAGVRVGGLDCQLQPGEVVGVQHAAEKTRFRVGWAGKKGSSQTGQAGMVCLESGKYIWGVPLQRLAASAKPALGPPDAAPAAAARAPVPEPEPEVTTERRSDARYATTGGVEITTIPDGQRMWGVLTDVGSTGCYVEMTTPPKTGAVVRVKLTLQGTDVWCTGEVRNSHVGVGMGISFVEMSVEDRHRLDDLVQRIAAGVTVPIKTAPAVYAGETNKTAPHPKAAVLAAQVRTITGALRSIGDVLDTTGLNLEERVFKEFRRTVDHTRQNSWALQRWLEDGAAQKDVYKLLDELELKRMQSAIELVRELSMDVDANALHLGTEGIDELAAVVEQLRNRLLALRQAGGSVMSRLEP